MRLEPRRVDKVIREVEALLMDLEALRDDLRSAIAESRVSRDEEELKALESLSVSLGRAYDALRALYTQLSLLRMKYS